VNYNWLKLTLAYAVAAIVQGAFASRIASSFVPDLCLIVIVFLGLRIDTLRGVLFSAAFGLVSDSLFTQTPGLNMGGYPVLFLATKLAATYFFAQSSWAKAALVLLSGLLIKLYHAAALWIIGTNPTIEIYPLALILTAAIAPWLIAKLEAWVLADGT